MRADWSEYSGCQPGGGEKFFHLDPLWASADIDAVGHRQLHAAGRLARRRRRPDAAIWRRAVRSRLSAGQHRRRRGVRLVLCQRRRPARRHAHADHRRRLWRAVGVALQGPRELVEQRPSRPAGRRARGIGHRPGCRRSKPIWFTELGCGAVDKGANQPNVFADPKSAESAAPYFSNGAPDALAQRQVLRAALGYWADDANNPASMSMTGAWSSGSTLWTWDARPYPAFPALTDVWSDGGNYATGHWLTGRLGGAGERRAGARDRGGFRRDAGRRRGGAAVRAWLCGRAADDGARRAGAAAGGDAGSRCTTRRMGWRSRRRARRDAGGDRRCGGRRRADDLAAAARPGRGDRAGGAELCRSRARLSSRAR